MTIKNEFEKKLEHLFHGYLKTIRSLYFSKNYHILRGSNPLKFSDQYKYLEHVLFKDSIIELNKILKEGEKNCFSSIINYAFYNDHYKGLIKNKNILEKYNLWKKTFSELINDNIIRLRDREYAHHNYHYTKDFETTLTFENIEKLMQGIGLIIADLYIDLGYERIPFPNNFMNDIEKDKEYVLKINPKA